MAAKKKAAPKRKAAKRTSASSTPTPAPAPRARWGHKGYSAKRARAANG